MIKAWDLFGNLKWHPDNNKIFAGESPGVADGGHLDFQNGRHFQLIFVLNLIIELCFGPKLNLFY